LSLNDDAVWKNHAVAEETESRFDIGKDGEELEETLISGG
jgi:hypothetical protein